MVQFHRAPRKPSSEPGTHSHLVSMLLSVDRLQDVSVFRVRRLFPFPDRFTTAIILPFVVDNAVVCETTGKRVGVLPSSAAMYAATGSGTSRAIVFSFVQLHSPEFHITL